jgi:hypothetical protein
MNARLEDRIAQPDRLVQALVVVAAALYLGFAGWLIAAEVSDGGVSHVPTVTIDNQTHLTLEVELVDQDGGRLTLGAHQPGLNSRSDVATSGRRGPSKCPTAAGRSTGRPSTAPPWPARAGPSTFPPRLPPPWNAPATSKPPRSLAAFSTTTAAASGAQHDRAALPGHPRPAPPRSTGHRRIGAGCAAAAIRPAVLHGSGHPSRRSPDRPARVLSPPRRRMHPECPSRPDRQMTAWRIAAADPGAGDRLQRSRPDGEGP